MIGLASIAMAAAAQAQGPKSSDVVFACQHFRNKHEAGDGSIHTVDMRAVKHADETWTLEWENRPAVTAMSFEAKFGSVGGSLGLRWNEQGKEKKAFISFSDIEMPDGKQYFWLTFDRPSLWQPPGYACESQGLTEVGAGA